VLVVVEPVLTLEVAVDLVLDDAVRHRDLGDLEQVLEDLVAGLDALLELLGLLGLAAQVVLELVEGVEGAGQLRELVVELRELTDLDGLDGDGAVGVLALVLATGERSGEGLGLAGGHADERVVHALEHVAGADLVGNALDGVDVGVTDPGGQVDRDVVTGLDRAVDPDEGAEALLEVGQALLDVLVTDGDVVDLHGDALELGQLDLRAHVGLDGELEVLAVGQRHRGHLDVRATDRLEVLGLGGLGEEPRKRLVDGLLDDRATADALVDDPRGHLALAKAGDLDRGRDRLVGLVELGLQLVERHLDEQLDPGRAEGLDGTLHFTHSTWDRCQGFAAVCRGAGLPRPPPQVGGHAWRARGIRDHSC